MITERPEMLPDTIRSRCIRIPFSPLSAAETSEVLRRYGSSFATHNSKVSDFSLLYEGRPGLLLDEEFRRYMELFERLTEEFKENKDSRPVVQNEDLTREDLAKALEILLVYLRNRLVHTVGKFDGLCHSNEIQVIIEKYKRLLALRELAHFNLNVKLTWNYIKAILS